MMTAPSNTEGYGGAPDSPDRNRQRNLVDDHSHEHNDGYNQGHVTGGTELHTTHHQSQRRLSRASSRRASVVSPVNYDVPDDYANLEASNISPVQNPDEESITRHETLEQVRSRDRDYVREQKQQRRDSQHVTGTESHPHHGQSQRRLSRASSRRASVVSPVNYDVPDDYANLEASNISPVQNPDEESITRYKTLEQVRSRDRDYLREQKQQRRESQLLGQQPPPQEAESSEDYDRERGQEKGEQQQAGLAKRQKVSRLATELYTISYLIFFSLLGTLARLGLQALTSNYPQSPIIFPSIWPNFAGCVVMGFLAEDRMLFRSPDWGGKEAASTQVKKDDDEETGSIPAEADVDPAADKKAHMALKKTIPLYIGLATGFCGSFTSFSSFIRDVFLALSNDLSPHSSSPNTPVVSRNGGYSFMALLSVLITTISLSLSGLFLGAHLAIAVAPLFTHFSLTLPYTFVSRILDRLAVLLGFGCWLGAVLLSIWPPDRHSVLGENERWRGTATFALVFAPLGCLMRFYASAHLNGRLPSFPLGTFAVNMFGTAVLGMAWDLEHVPSLGGVVGCQVLQGVADGFCGCLTTVSTWVSELAALRRRNAYVYGGCSVGGGLALLVVVMGSLRWTEGFGEVRCVH